MKDHILLERVRWNTVTGKLTSDFALNKGASNYSKIKCDTREIFQGATENSTSTLENSWSFRARNNFRGPGGIQFSHFLFARYWQLLRITVVRKWIWNWRIFINEKQSCPDLYTSVMGILDSGWWAQECCQELCREQTLIGAKERAEISLLAKTKRDWNQHHQLPSWMVKLKGIWRRWRLQPPNRTGRCTEDSWDVVGSWEGFYGGLLHRPKRRVRLDTVTLVCNASVLGHWGKGIPSSSPET